MTAEKKKAKASDRAAFVREAAAKALRAATKASASSAKGSAKTAKGTNTAAKSIAVPAKASVKAAKDRNTVAKASTQAAKPSGKATKAIGATAKGPPVSAKAPPASAKAPPASAKDRVETAKGSAAGAQTTPIQKLGIPMPTSAQNTRPRHDFNDITQRGLKAYALATQYATQLTGRLDPSVATTLSSNLSQLGAVVPGAISAAQDAKATTLAQADELNTGYQMISAARHAVTRMKASASVKAAYGVGMKTNRISVKDVVAALQKIVDRMTAQPAEAQSFGFLLPDDLNTYTAQLATIKSADSVQEQARANKPVSTKQRNIVGNQVLTAVDAISAAGVLAFANSVTERGEFEALVKG